MDKKLLFLIVFFILHAYYSFAQQAACTPDPKYTNTSTQKGTHPDTTTNLAPSYVNTPYSQTITIVVPNDTTIQFLGTIKWDSTVLKSVSGLPPGFSYACANSSSKPNACSWKGNSIGCIIITGTPSVSDIGSYPLLFYTNNYLAGNVNANSYVAKGYRIIVNAAAGIHENQDAQFLYQNNPNPFDDISEVQFTAPYSGTAQFKIYNLVGGVIQQYEVTVKKGVNKIKLDARDFDSGVYFYSLVHETDAFTRKMVVLK